MQMLGDVAQTHSGISANAALFVLGLHSCEMTQHLDVQIVVVQLGCQMNDGLASIKNRNMLL